MWDVEPDSGTPAGRDEIVRETVASARPGSIIVLHVMYQSGGESLAAIPEIVRRLRAAGYEFTTVSRLIGA